MNKHVEHLAVENQQLSSHNFSIVEWNSTMQEELGPMEDTMEQLDDEMILI